MTCTGVVNEISAVGNRHGNIDNNDKPLSRPHLIWLILYVQRNTTIFDHDPKAMSSFIIHRHGRSRRKSTVFEQSLRPDLYRSPFLDGARTGAKSVASPLPRARCWLYADEFTRTRSLTCATCATRPFRNPLTWPDTDASNPERNRRESLYQFRLADHTPNGPTRAKGRTRAEHATGRLPLAARWRVTSECTRARGRTRVTCAAGPFSRTCGVDQTPASALV